MATIADVAKRAGVSMMTVSRVINKSGQVSEQTRRRVLSAIDELQYRPNMVAKGLATGRNQLVAYVMSNLANPFFANVSMGVENACVERDYSVIIYDVSSLERLDACLDMLVDRQIDGVIFHHLNISDAHIARLGAGGVHCVTIDNEYELKGLVSVDSDDCLGARMATDHLIGKGHTRIGCIHGNFGPATPFLEGGTEFIEAFQRKIWRNRTDGFLDALKSAGLEPACMMQGNSGARSGFVSGRECLRKILEAGNPPTALYCQNDILALGVLGECLETGVRVPGEMAIIGHDGLDFGMLLYPRITTIRQPQYQMGFTAAQKLLDCIEMGCAPEKIITRSAIFHGDTV